MASTQKKTTFMYAARSFEILCTGKEKVSEMIQKFINKFNPDSRIHDYNFYYEGKIINPNSYEQPVENNEHFGKKESFIITVEKNIKVIACPKCNYGDCVVSLINYKTTFYNCEHKHLEISSYDNYFTDQIYYPEKIRCAGNNCTKNAKMDPNFFLCLTCSKLLGKTRSICSECFQKHKHEYKDENKHFIINYEDKNYYCKDHCKRMEHYCFQCKKNLCNGCLKDHSRNQEKYKDHKIKSIELLIPEDKEIERLKESLKEINRNMESLKIVIDDLVYTLNGAMRVYQNYYKIANHIITKYESFNKGEKDFKNFTIFKCLRNLKFSNIQVLEDLKSIINEKDKLDKAKTLIGIYSDKKKNYYMNEKIGNDLNKEDDEQWFKEVCEREREREKEKEKKLKENNMPTNSINNNSNNINGGENRTEHKKRHTKKNYK